MKIILSIALVIFFSLPIGKGRGWAQNIGINPDQGARWSTNSIVTEQMQKIISKEINGNARIISSSGNPLKSEYEPYDKEPEVFTSIVQMPAFPGGEMEMIKFLAQNVNFPRMSKELGITGIVYVEFIVNTEGNLTNIKIAKGVSSDIDKEALRVVQMMPKWIPGMQKNTAVPIEICLPIMFTLI